MNFCEVCVKTFSCSRSFETHLKSKSHKLRCENTVALCRCACGRTFNQSSSLSRHKKKCSQTRNSNHESDTGEANELQSLRKENKEIREMLAKKDLEMDELRKKVEMLFASSGGNTTTNIETQNNIENQNVIIVNNFGNENTDYLTGKIVKNLIKNNAPYACIPRLIQSIHFNPKHPENHNIKVTNARDKHAKIFKDNKWIRAMKNRTIDDLIETICVFLEEKYEENKDFLSDFRKERFQEFYDKYGDQDKNLMKNIKDEVDITLINGSNEIHK